jgi:NTE family protein
VRAVTHPTLQQWLSEGPFALAMSSGFFGFYAHAGALTALEDTGFTASSYAGSSAGALVTGMRAGGVSLDEIRRDLASLRRGDFWDPGVGLGVLRGRRFRSRLESMLKVERVEHCAAPYAASVYDLGARTTKVLTRAPLALAIHASCAVPGLFQPVWHEGRALADGGIADRPGIMGLREGERVLHHHLASRSPWRREGSPSMRPPRRAGLVAVSIDGVTRLHPFALERGMVAFREAEAAMRRALAEPVRDGLVALHV